MTNDVKVRYELSACRAEADRICHERGITDFLRAIEPFQKEIAKLYGFRYLKRIILGESENTTEYEWISPEAPKMIAQWQELIEAEAKKYGFQGTPDRVVAATGE